MKMDRNTVIGFVLLAVLLFVYLYSSTRNSHDLQAQRQHYEDSVATVQRKLDSTRMVNDTTRNQAVKGLDTTVQQTQGVEQLTVLENEVLKISFTNKGGQPGKVELKKYKSVDSNLVALNSTDFDKISYSVNLAANQAAQISELFFAAPQVAKNADGSQTITYQLPTTNGVIAHVFTLKPNAYMIDWTVQMNGADQLLTQGAFNIVWQSRPIQHESDVAYERQMTNVCFYENNDFDYIMSKSEKQFEKPVQWVSVAQQFFNITLVNKANFSSGNIKWNRHAVDSSDILGDVATTLQTKVPLGAVASIPLQLYYGPTEYHILKEQSASEMDKLVNLGRDFYTFVRPINKYVVMPVFDFFRSFVGSFGLVIALLTLFIRLLTSPLVYTSYLSGAKMKALRPEIDKLRAKFGSDQQSIGMEQMKLFREAGVNPLGGCIPALLQIPIFFALYSFFNSNIALRGEEFLWAHNLASYDIIAKFSFNIPGLGNHLSLFTLTAVVTSFLISLYNMNMTPDQNNPALKYMPYIFPFILLFVFNRLPAALTWYYTVSNLITLILQFIIQNYIIDHDKILAKIDENRKKPKAQSKWGERLAQMQEAQKKLQNEKTKKK
ncbi:MAG: membrane protein insertase YidC [Candidatus Pseudobacter hemicellulosilyticus]|uniref:Membrane protein insertase YidC n=1 Tax=Candidatus Pseudobacter hemicellulosilyticus TaxID=3121375 RepID=A0AAJ6BH05_9BACT|nr:MAG: membrane protein insertase YidC [Pseudobacter sp.]